jgi:hypothetical protein
MPDPNLETAMKWARELGPTPELPASLKKVEKRAKLVDMMDTQFVAGANLGILEAQTKSDLLESLGKVTSRFMPKEEAASARCNTALRLWAGCISAAKTISEKNNEYRNTPETRARDFALIDSYASNDAVYRAGVEAAPAFKELRLEKYYLDGVPATSAVRKYTSVPEDRSMRLLQPKIVVLYSIFLKGGVPDNKTELSKALHYQATGWTSTMVTELREEGYLQKRKIFSLRKLRSEECLVLTRKGKKKIAPLALVKYLPLFMALIALMPFSQALNEILLHFPIQPLDLTSEAAAIVGLAVFFWYEARLLEREYYRV